MKPKDPARIVLFDGVCNLCSRSVRFILKHDRDRLFHFASLQSAPGRDLCRAHDVDPDDLGSMLYIEEGVCFRRSDAVLHIARHLGWPWKAGAWALAVPRTLRDAVYRLVARNRYRWFGRRAACWLPEPEDAARFLDDPAAPDPGGPSRDNLDRPRT